MGSCLVIPTKKTKPFGQPMSPLPPEVVAEVLACLPVESLFRFKCVCKSWKALFESPKFRLHRARHTSCFLVGRRRFSDWPAEEENFISLLSGDDQIENLDLPSTCCKHALDLVVSGQSNGLICLNHDDHVLLCNPATGEFKLLPPSAIPLPETARTIGVGFGRDPRSDDCKVVRVVGSRSGSLPPRVEIFALSSDSWREIENPHLGAKILSSSCSETSSDGFYYWWAAAAAPPGKRLILSFDIAREVFDEIPIPDFPNGLFLNLATIDGGSVALIVHPVGSCNWFDIWVRDEPGRSWSKKFAVQQVPAKLEIPVTFRSSRELLLQDEEGRLVCYNLSTGSVTKLPLCARLFSFFAVVFVKSLVSLKHS